VNAVEPIFVGQWRRCHNPECRVSYTVEHPTNYHCSDECAAACLFRRLDLTHDQA